MVYVDPSALQLLPGALLGTLACGWVGLAYAQTLLPRATQHDREVPLALLVAVALGFGLTASLAFWLHGLGGPRVSAPTVIAMAQLQMLVLAGCARYQGRGAASVAVPDQRWRALRSDGRLWLLPTLAIGVVWLLRHDASIPPASCIGEAAICAVGQGPPGCDVLRHNVGDAQMGNAGLVAAALALYGAVGFQVLYALAGAMLALGGWAVAQAALGAQPDRLALLLALVATSLNPYVLSIPLLDENVLTLAWSLAGLGLLLAVGEAAAPIWGQWLAVGVLLGLVGDLRHPMVAVVPAVLAYVAWVSKGRRLQAVTALSIGGLLATAFEHAHHKLAIGSFFQFEHNLQYAQLPYTVLGHTLQWAGMLNWPLHSELVRTPDNPYPMLLGWGLWLADHLGLLGLAATLVGAVALLRQQPRIGWLLLGWFGPVLAGLALQEAWDYPNKMGILLIGAATWPAWWAATWRLGRRKPLVALGAVLTVAAACRLAVVLIADWQVPADSRYFARFGLAPVESAAHLQFAKQRALDIGVLPDFGRVFRYSAVDRPWLAGPLWHRPGAVPWGWLPGEVPPAGQAVTLEVDLGHAPWATPGVRLVPVADADIDLTQGQGMVVVPGLVVPWESQPLVATLARGPHVTVVELALRDFRVREAGCDPKRSFCHCEFMDSLDPGALQTACSGTREVASRSGKLRIRLPAGAVSLIFTVNPAGNVVDLWRGIVTQQGGILRGPVQFWHN